MEKGKLSALLPIGVFLAAFLGISFISGDFRSMPAIVGFLMALLCAFLQNRKMSFEEKISVVANGVGKYRGGCLQPTIGLSMGSPMEELEKGLKELKGFAAP